MGAEGALAIVPPLYPLPWLESHCKKETYGRLICLGKRAVDANSNPASDEIRAGSFPIPEKGGQSLRSVPRFKLFSMNDRERRKLEFNVQKPSLLAASSLRRAF